MSERSDENMPAWKRQSVERSLQTARARANERSDRFVAAAIDLMQDSGSIDFTVQDVVDGSRMSIRTFYNFFASKDDLLVAVHETILARQATRLRQRCAAETDPVRRVRAFIDGMDDLTAHPGPVSRALSTSRNRLAETRPGDLDRAFKPQIDLVVELVREAAASGRLRSDLAPVAAAHMLHHAVVAAVHARILAGDAGTGIDAGELWAFCALGLGVEPTVQVPADMGPTGAG